ncbi:P-loop NTPase [Adlercreutzia sp. ZJ154]|uniref:AAA family ATPase n=1 Tax=Adlercreutzia sp. ZJ154 TaxID=2709790 RepID=UPI0013ED839F|nr:P-loop NTPase [Adlercreutzia sp. ZJ154]
MRRILLCAPAEVFLHPEILGFGDINLSSIDWLLLESDAKTARNIARNSEDVCKVWIVGSDDVEAINLAAAMRTDNLQLPVYVVADSVSGSLCSRAKAAGLSGVLALDDLVQRFLEERDTRGRLLDSAKSLEANASTPTELCSDQSFEAQHRNAQIAAQQQKSKAEGNAYVLTVLSGSGGAGKSTVSAVAADVAASQGCKVLLFDCDLQFGDLAYLTGANEPITADDILSEMQMLETLALQVQEGGVALLAAPKRLEQAEVVGAHISDILSEASKLFDMVVVNTGASWAEYHVSLIEHSDCALFLIDQKASSVRACRHAVELCSRLGIASGTFAYAINKCKRGALFTSMDVACAMQGAHVYELKDGGVDVEELLGAGSSHDLLASKNALCTSVSEMLDEMLPSSLSGNDKKRIRKSKASNAKTVKTKTTKVGKRTSRRRSYAENALELPAPHRSHVGKGVRA